MGRMNDASINIGLVCANAEQLASYLYEIAGHCGKIAHTLNKIAELSDKDATSTTDNTTTPEG